MKPIPVRWIDFGSPDPVKTSAFYAELFGWTFDKDSSPEYYEFKIEGDFGGGIYKNTDIPERTSVTTYLLVEGIDNYIERIKKLGGSIVFDKTEIPNGGFYAHFKDPVGNTLGLYQSGRPSK